MKAYRDLTKRQTDVLAEIATGNSLPHCRTEVLDALVEKGFAVRVPDRVLGRDAFGPVTVPQYEMPVSRHIEFCSWLASQVS